MLTPEEVKHIAKLARIELSDAEVQKFQGQLDIILEYVDKLKEVDTEGVEPTSQITGLVNRLRADNAARYDNVPGILANAPALNHQYIKVKKVL